MKAIVVQKKKMQPFYYQKSSTKRDTNIRGVDGQPQQIHREQQIPGKTEGLADPTLAHHL